MSMERQPTVDVRDWTLLVYMVSDQAKQRNLPTDRGAVADLKEIVDLDAILASERRAILEAAAQSPNIHVAIQADYLKKDGLFRSHNGQEETRLEESVATDPKVLDEFFKW